MDSINQQQPEDNIKDLGGAEAIAKIKELAEKAESCFFCTNIKTGLPFSTRPMAVLQVDEKGDLWFMSSKDSTKNMELEKEPLVQVLFQASAHAGFLSIYGLAELSEEKAKIEELWNPMIKTWFTEGKDDPRISLIKVSPTQGYYWDNKHGNVIAFIKQAASVVIGKTFDDSIEGQLKAS